MENKLDGNAAAGIMQQIFAFEMTRVDFNAAATGRVLEPFVLRRDLFTARG